MNLKPLKKDKYTLNEVCSRLQEVHKDYDYEYINEKISSGELPAYLDLKNCYLFPVEEFEKSYDYLEVCNTTQTSNPRVVLSFLVKPGIFNTSKNKVISKNEINDDSYIENSTIKESLINCIDLGEIKPRYRFHVVNSCDLLNSSFSIERSRELLKGPIPLNSGKPIIRVSECGLAVVPWYRDDHMGTIFISKDKIPSSLCSLNLSPKRDDMFNFSVACSRVVEFNESFFYVVNNKSYEYDGELLEGYSFSRDVQKSYKGGRGIVILRSDLEKFEHSVILQSRFCNQNKASSEVFEDEKPICSKKEQTLGLMLILINDFLDSEYYKKYGTKTPQGIIEDWLTPRVPESTRKSVDGISKPNRDYIRVLKVLISEKYGITTLRSGL